MTDTEKTRPVPAEPQASAPPPAVESVEEAPQQEGWAPKGSRRRKIVFALVILVGALAALYAWRLPPFGSSIQTTDNAYVRGQTTIISPQVSGYVTDVDRRGKGTPVAG